jgi:hypothetical protein
MPNNIQANVEIEEYEENDDLGADDFGFILGPDGSLKSFMIPEHLMDAIPEEVQWILDMFGIDDVHGIATRVLH